MNYIIDRVEDHEYYYDLFMENLPYVFEEFEHTWKGSSVKTLNYVRRSHVIKTLGDEFIRFSNLKDVLNSHFNKKISYGQSWLNRYGKGEFQDPHWHIGKTGRPDLSFVYFLKIPENSHCFNFCNKDGSNKKYINEKSGDLLIFDSASYHSVDPNTSDDYRYTIAGNLDIK